MPYLSFLFYDTFTLCFVDYYCILLSSYYITFLSNSNDLIYTLILGIEDDSLINEGDLIVQAIQSNNQVDVEIASWPTQDDSPIDEYNTPNILAYSFPVEFAFGIGDVTNQNNRMFCFTFHFAIMHYQYVALEINGIYIYPLAEPRFSFYCHDVDERQRIQSQASIYIKHDPATANLTVRELKEMSNNEFSPTMFAAKQKLERYASIPYMKLKKDDLISLVNACGSPTTWFTLSSPCSKWPDLRKLMQMPLRSTDNDGVLESDESYRKKCRKVQMKFYVNNPHIINEMFVRRVKSFLKGFFGPDCLNAEWYWYRFEWQKRKILFI